MKKFKFRFESLLKMKIDKEEQVSKELGIMVSELEMITLELEKNESRLHTFEEESKQLAKQGVTISEIRRLSDGIDHLRKKRKEIEQCKLEKEEEIALQKQKLVAAMKDRKIMDKLKENAFANYMEEFEQSEKKVTEEIVNYKSSQKKEIN